MVKAVDVLKENADKIRLILMDLYAVMNGYDAGIMESIRGCANCCTYRRCDTGVRQCAENGIYHYISKPFDPDKFLKLKHYLRKVHFNMDDNAILGARRG